MAHTAGSLKHLLVQTPQPALNLWSSQFKLQTGRWEQREDAISSRTCGEFTQRPALKQGLRRQLPCCHLSLPLPRGTQPSSFRKYSAQLWAPAGAAISLQFPGLSDWPGLGHVIRSGPIRAFPGISALDTGVSELFQELFTAASQTRGETRSADRSSGDRKRGWTAA